MRCPFSTGGEPRRSCFEEQRTPSSPLASHQRAASTTRWERGGSAHFCDKLHISAGWVGDTSLRPASARPGRRPVAITMTCRRFMAASSAIPLASLDAFFRNENDPTGRDCRGDRHRVVRPLARCGSDRLMAATDPPLRKWAVHQGQIEPVARASDSRALGNLQQFFPFRRLTGQASLERGSTLACAGKER